MHCFSVLRAVFCDTDHGEHVISKMHSTFSYKLFNLWVYHKHNLTRINNHTCYTYTYTLDAYNTNPASVTFTMIHPLLSESCVFCEVSVILFPVPVSCSGFNYLSQTYSHNWKCLIQGRVHFYVLSLWHGICVPHMLIPDKPTAWLQLTKTPLSLVIPDLNG